MQNIHDLPIKIMVGQRIRKKREERNLKLRELGDAIVYDYSNLSKVERGEYSASIELLGKLAKYFDVSVGYFYGEESNKQKRRN